MNEQIIPNLGSVPDRDARRDAVHIAVAPVVAAERLLPGQHVGSVANGRFGTQERPIGIVDPYLKEAVLPDQGFWLFLYPGTVTSLRHVWTHPDFKAKVPVATNAIQEQR